MSAYNTFAQPVFTSTPIEQARVEEEYNYEITTGGWVLIPPEILLYSGELPSGVKLDDKGNGRGKLKGKPKKPGVYAVSLMVRRVYDYNSYSIQSFNITVSKKEAAIELSELNYTYDGVAHSPKIKTSPKNLDVEVKYNGSTTKPVNAGTYTVEARIDDDEYEGFATAIMVISKANAQVTLTSANKVYSGAPQHITTSTTPANLPLTITYNGSATAPVNAGTYSVLATINDTNYQGSASGSFVIDKKEGGIRMSGLSATYDGTAKTAITETTPENLKVKVTYNGTISPPVDIGSYAVVASIDELNYFGEATGTMVINAGGNGGGSDGGGDSGGDNSGGGDSGGGGTPAGAPVISNVENQPLYYRQGDPAMSISETLIINDFDDNEMVSAVVRLVKNYVEGEDILIYDNDDNEDIIAEFDATTGTMTLTGVDNRSEYELALSAIKYKNTVLGDTENSINKTISITVNDGTYESRPVRRDVAIFVLPELDIVNAFTPNGDNVNDYWNFVNLERYSVISISVFDKNGTQLFECLSSDCNWDGTYHGKLMPAGIYFYTIDLDKGKRKYRGTVALLR